MRMRYQFRPLSREQRIVVEYALLDGMERQRWFAIVSLELWKSEGIICVQ